MANPTNFKNNRQLAIEAGRKGKRGPAKVYCPWCSADIARGTLVEHTKSKHRNEYRRYFKKEGSDAAATI